MLDISKRIYKLLSPNDIDTKKYYRLERNMVNLTNISLLNIDRFAINDKIAVPEGHEVPVRIFFPRKKMGKKLLIFFHGGGWVTGSLFSYEKVCTHMANITHSVVISVDYRLAPEHKFPAAPMDCFEVSKILQQSAKKIGLSPNEVVLIGDSAGGNLAAVVSLMARDQDIKIATAQILLYPATDSDHSETSPYPSVHENGTDYILTNTRVDGFMELYRRDENDMQDPYFAPMHTKNFADQPNTLIITSEFDPLRDEGMTYGEKLREAGNYVETYEIPDALHGYMTKGLLTAHQVSKTYEYINAFLKKVFGNE